MGGFYRFFCLVLPATAVFTFARAGVPFIRVAAEQVAACRKYVPGPGSFEIKLCPNSVFGQVGVEYGLAEGQGLFKVACVDEHGQALFITVTDYFNEFKGGCPVKDTVEADVVFLVLF